MEKKVEEGDDDDGARAPTSAFQSASQAVTRHSMERRKKWTFHMLPTARAADERVFYKNKMEQRNIGIMSRIPCRQDAIRKEKRKGGY